MAEASLKLGTDWATKEGSLLGFNDENGNYKPIPFDFTRATTATRVNRDGLIEEVQDNIPRIDFSSGDGSLLLEPQRTNLITYSEDISSWTNSGGLTRTYNIALSPDGNITADGIQDETGGTFKYIYQQVSVSANSTYSGSLFVKKELSETNYMGITLYFTGGSAKIAYGIINTVDGTIVEAGSTITPTFKVDDYGDYWRFSITATDNGSNTSVRFGVYACLSTNGTSLGVGISSVRTIWGAQLEAGSYATSLIKTSGASVTLNTDQAIPPSTSYDLSGSFSIFFSFGKTRKLTAGSTYFYWLNTNANDFMLYTNSSGSSGLNVYLPNQGGYVFDSSQNDAWNADASKICITYNATTGRLAYFINGSKYNEQTSILSFTGDDVGSFIEGGSNNLAEIKQYMFFTQALSDEEVINLTTI